MGLCLAQEDDGYEIHRTVNAADCVCRKFVFQDDVLVGAVGINVTMDPGVLKNLILRQIHLGDSKEAFIANPLDVSRQLMWNRWRGVAA